MNSLPSHPPDILISDDGIAKGLCVVFFDNEVNLHIEHIQTITVFRFHPTHTPGANSKALMCRVHERVIRVCYAIGCGEKMTIGDESGPTLVMPESLQGGHILEAALWSW